MSYLPHEYLNENWFIFHVADVAEMFARRSFLSWVRRRSPRTSTASQCPPRCARWWRKLQIRSGRRRCETSPCNKQFRRDIYARGITTLNNLETLRQLHATRYTLAMPRSAITFKIPSLLGELDAKPEIYGAIADLLANDIVPFDAIMTMPALAEVGLGGTLQALALMVHAGQVLPILGEPEANHEPAKRFNRCWRSLPAKGRIHNFVAAPRLREPACRLPRPKC